MIVRALYNNLKARVAHVAFLSDEKEEGGIFCAAAKLVIFRKHVEDCDSNTIRGAGRPCQLIIYSLLAPFKAPPPTPPASQIAPDRQY